MIKTILYIWQLPQNIVALISIAIFKAKYGYKLNSKKNTVNIYFMYIEKEGTSTFAHSFSVV